ncbi:MAG: tRNA (N(6)-L-threonylcarbamoyladenosine(37)-C(2))-methylthiotransferase [Nanoarchaeota archaeon]
MRVFIKTFGCQANIADSEAMAGILKERKFKLTDSEEEADAIVVNTCSVKNKTQSKILHYLRKYSGKKKLFIGGCLIKTIDVRKAIPFVEAVFDTNNITKIAEILENKKDYFSSVKENRIGLPVVRYRNEIGIINISQGCLNKCTFCATKLSRGNLKSYRIGDIKRAVENAVSEGCKIIYLTSQDNGCYGFDIGTNLPELLKEVVAVEGDFKFRVGMMNPWHLRKILQDLLKVYESDKIIKFLHIPVQSGSERGLKEMFRSGSLKEFRNAVLKFREKFPQITIATDIILGYPTETEMDFEQTLELIKETKPQVVNMSAFSSRQGTLASKLKQLPSEIVKQRTRRLNELYWKYRELTKIQHD